MKIELKDDEIRAVIAKQFDDVKELVVGVKSILYGTRGVFETGLFTPDAPPGLVIRARMSDKVERLRKLWQGAEGTADETIEDTVRDLMGYCALWLAWKAMNSEGGQGTEPKAAKKK